MFNNVQSTSTLKAWLSMLSSTLFFTVAMNFQSISFEQLMHSSSSSLSLSSRLAYLLRNKARLVSKFVIVAFSIPILKGFTTYSSAPIFNPSRMFFSSFSAVSRMIGICEVSISFLIAVHNSSPRISGIIMSEMINSGLYSFTIVRASLPLLHICMVYASERVCPR